MNNQDWQLQKKWKEEHYWGLGNGQDKVKGLELERLKGNGTR